jgi:hypothetical protein
MSDDLVAAGAGADGVLGFSKYEEGSSTGDETIDGIPPPDAASDAAGNSCFSALGFS